MNYTPYTGCPCGCMTKPPWFDDPDCIRHRREAPPPVPSLRDILADTFPAPVDAPVDAPVGNL